MRYGLLPVAVSLFFAFATGERGEISGESSVADRLTPCGHTDCTLDEREGRSEQDKILLSSCLGGVLEIAV